MAERPESEPLKRLPPAGPSESVAPARWEEGHGDRWADQLAHYATCTACGATLWDGAETTYYEAVWADLLRLREFLEERLLLDPAASCPACDSPAETAGVRLFLHSETLGKDLVVTCDKEGIALNFLDQNGISAEIPASDPRLRAVFLDSLCRAAAFAARFGKARAERMRAPLEEALRQNPRAPEAWIALAHILAVTDAPRKKLKETLDQAVRRADGLGFHGSVRLAEGFAALADHPRGKDPDAAADALYWYREALGHDASATAVQYALGQRLYAAGEMAAAESHLSVAMQDPEFSLDAAYLLGRAALRLGRYERAQSIFREIVRVAGPVPHFLRMQALVETAAGDIATGQRIFERARELEPDEPENETIYAAMLRFMPAAE